MSLLGKILGNSEEFSIVKLNEKYSKLLIKEEIIELGFKVIRDVFIFTNKRLILIDVQRISGRKVEYLSLPYKNISRFSLETAGSLDLDAELKIWISGENSPTVSKRFGRSIDIIEIQKYLAKKVLL